MREHHQTEIQVRGTVDISKTSCNMLLSNEILFPEIIIIETHPLILFGIIGRTIETGIVGHDVLTIVDGGEL